MSINNSNKNQSASTEPASKFHPSLYALCPRTMHQKHDETESGFLNIKNGLKFGRKHHLGRNLLPDETESRE